MSGSVIENKSALANEKLEETKPTATMNYDYEKISSEQQQQQQQNTDEKNPTKEISIDDFLGHVGQIGRFQILVLLVCSTLFILPSHQSLLLIFIAHSPPWKCTNTTDTCSGANIHYEGQPGFNSRCDMERWQWTYTLPKSHSIVSEVNKLKL